jgi:hypothetical protein
MGRPRGTFTKRAREVKLKERAAAKAARREAQRGKPRDGKGPPIEALTPEEMGLGLGGGVGGGIDALGPDATDDDAPSPDSD